MEIDLKGWRCPMLAIKAKKAVQQHINYSGGKVKLIVDDPKAEKDLQAMARSMGWTIRYVGGQMVHGGVKEYEVSLV